MSLKLEYFDYLNHFGETICLGDYCETDKNAIALRHDVDYCIDTALEMAYWEKEQGIKSTYFVLHTADYWQESEFVDKCKQIQDFGHEVGLHTNLITRWYENGKSVEGSLREILSPLQKGGVNVSGSSAHGDRACYEKNFINYWLFKELKPEVPDVREHKLNAEGIFEKDLSKRIEYPDAHRLVNDQGDVLPLWQIAMSDFGLDYEASHLDFDHYYSDSGGAWKRTENPLDFDLQTGRHQVLVHPIHWKGPKKIIFFLSTARSGSKWLSTLLDSASSCKAKHEFTLNHYEDGNKDVLPDKMTGPRLHELLGDNDKIEQALLTTRSIVDEMGCDYAEANVYLPMVMSQLSEHFPDAKLVHLYRDPKKVVRSIKNRGWYDTPLDTSHPVIPVADWGELSSFEKCCQYVSYINELLSDECPSNVQFETLAGDIKCAEEFLKKLGIPFYPYLARDVFGKRINQNVVSAFPDFDQWSPKNKIYYETNCTGIENRLGYSHSTPSYLDRLMMGLGAILSSVNRIRVKRGDVVRMLVDTKRKKLTAESGFCDNCRISEVEKKVKIESLSDEKHSSFILGGGAWNKLESRSGWKFEKNRYYMLNIEYELPSDDAIATVFCLMYDDKKMLIYKRLLGRLDTGMKMAEFSFAIVGRSKFFNIAFYLPVQDGSREIVLKSVSMKNRFFS